MHSYSHLIFMTWGMQVGYLLLLGIAALAKARVVTDMDKFIEEVNARIPNGQWLAGKNFDSLEDFKLTSYYQERPDRVKKYREGSGEDLKAYSPKREFDARKKWPHCKSIGTIWDQGNCAASWAVAAAGAISDRICVQLNSTVMVSAEYLVACCHDCRWLPCYGAPGENGWDYWRDVGLVSGGVQESDFCQPYSLEHCSRIESGPYKKCTTWNGPGPTCGK